MKQIFQAPFNYTTYSQEIVHRLFGCTNLNKQENLEHLATTDEGDEVYYIGDREDAEGTSDWFLLHPFAQQRGAQARGATQADCPLFEV